MSVYEHHGSFLAEWRDEHGKKDRKAFPVQPDAVQYERKMRREVKLRKNALRRDPTLAVGKVGDLCDLWAEGQKYWYAKRVARDFKVKAGQLRLPELTPFAVNQMLDYWQGIGLARNTRANFAHVLKRILRYFESLPGCPRDLAKFMRRAPSYQPRTRTATVEEERKLLELSKSKPWLHAWLTIFLTTGLRMSEVCSLAPRHYDRARKMIRNVRTKGDIQRVLPVLPELAAILDPLMADPQSETPFLDLLKGAPLTFANIRWHWGDLKKKAGIEAPLRGHDLRRTAITTFHENHTDERGRPLRDLEATRRFAGHKYIGSTQIYTQHLTDEALAPLMERARVLRFKLPGAARIAAAKKTG